MLAKRKTWDEIGAALGRSRSAAIDKAKAIGLHATRRVVAAHQALPPTRIVERGQEVLRAGHPISWGAITKGTLLECAPYSYGENSG